MPTTTNFSWTTPADTDYVKDGASAIRTLANGIDTSMAQLKGGTAGQILSKTSGTDMAFTWINNDQGDLTAVTAGTGISVTNGTGPIPTVAIDTATTVDKTTAQALTNKDLSNATNTFPTSLVTLTGSQTLTNKTLTSPIVSTISNTGTLTLPTSTDTLVGRATTDTLTNKTISASSNTLTGVINNTLTTTTGDIIYASAANTPARLGIGSTNQVLTVSGGVPTWATPSSGGGMTSIASGSLSGGALSLTSISGSYKNLVLYIMNYYSSSDFDLNLTANSLSAAGSYSCFFADSTTTNNTSVTWTSYYSTTALGCNFAALIDNTDGDNFTRIEIPNYADTTALKKCNIDSIYKRSTGQTTIYKNFGSINTTSAITRIDVTPSAGTWSAGTYVLYGVS